ncbi:MAG: STAS domain-containing protein [Candidatus Poribacteria bacterium]|nr:STAS domain-containing protein [Candidatus Poribacteria bacterium]
MKMMTRLKDGIPILEPHGKIVGPAISELREKLALELLDASDTPCFLINFEHVHKIDSSGLGMLVNVHIIAVQMKSRIGIINVGRHIKSFLVLSRLVNIFEHFESEDAAISALTSD